MMKNDFVSVGIDDKEDEEAGKGVKYMEDTV